MFASCTRFVVLVLTSTATACVGIQRRDVPQPPRAYALIADTIAVFRFPPDTVDWYTWDVPDGTHYPGRPDFYWEVGWSPPIERRGVDPEGLTLFARWSSGGPHEGPLARLLVGRAVDVATWCTPCGAPAMTTVRDSAVTYAVDGRHLIFFVRGTAAIRRLFPRRPEVVTFTRGGRGGRRVKSIVAVSSDRE